MKQHHDKGQCGKEEQCSQYQVGCEFQQAETVPHLGLGHLLGDGDLRGHGHDVHKAGVGGGVPAGGGWVLTCGVAIRRRPMCQRDQGGVCEVGEGLQRRIPAGTGCKGGSCKE